jgi:hypothetical protein
MVTFETGCSATAFMPGAFQACSSLQSICIPSSVESLGSCCFKDCQRLCFVTFASGSRLLDFGDPDFASCPSLRLICVPASVRKMTGNGFALKTAPVIEIDP